MEGMLANLLQPLCDIDVLSEVAPEDEAALGTTAEQAGDPSSPQQPQKAAEQHQSEVQNQKPPEATPKAEPSGKHSSLATPAVRGLLKDLKIDITQVTGTGKDGRVLKEDVQNHAAASQAPSAPSSSPSPQPPHPSTTPQSETSIPLTPIQSQ
ncbi:MAG: hypothetical protein Q9174_006094, partial [Haloplaca sp. 1 TL-2023]